MPTEDTAPTAESRTTLATSHAQPAETSTDAAEADSVTPQQAATRPGRSDANVQPRSDRTRRLPRAVNQALREVPPPLRLPLATYLACQMIFLLWWAAFYPGLMSRDSVIYVLHVTTGPWVNNHSVLYDSMVWLSLHATGGLAALTLAQTAAMAAALAYTVFAFGRLGVPGRWTAVAAVIVAALPPLASFTVFIWKDVPFSICVFLVVPTVAHLIARQRQSGWRGSGPVNWLLVALGLELLGACLFRLNGFLVVLLAGVLLVVLLPGVRARLTAVIVAAVLLAWVLNTTVYPAFGIQKMPTSLGYGTTYADIAVAYADRPSSFTAADLRLMRRVAPLAKWKSSANCYDSDKTNFIGGFADHAADAGGQLFSLWLRILRRSPDLILRARICRGAIAWQIFPAGAASVDWYLAATAGASRIPRNLFGMANWPTVRHNPYRDAMATRPLSHDLGVAAVFLRKASQVPQLEWLLWRGATWCYIAYLAVWVFARRRRNRSLLALAAIVAGQQLTVLVNNPAQLFRYMAAPIFIGIMLVPLLFVRDAPAPPARGERRPDTREADASPLTGDRNLARVLGRALGSG